MKITSKTPAGSGPTSKSAGATPAVDLDEARYFLDLLEPGGGKFTFQTFDDRKGGKPDRSLIKVLHGQFDEHAEQLRKLNDQSAGIFVMVNEGDGEMHEGAKSCRTSDNVIRVRALYIDLDDGPLDPAGKSEPPPSIIVNSSPGRYHVYWCVSSCSLGYFTALQKELIAKFESDPSVHDLCRVLRLPGFVHRKAAPFLTRVIHPARSAA